jgi:predicted RNase H-like HicB family nuclease
MIESFQHKGLKRFYERGERRGLSPNMIPKIEEILSILSAAESVEEANIPGYRLHPLTGDKRIMSGKLTYYIKNAMETATFQLLEDSSFLGEIPSLKDVWSHDKILEDCRKALQEVLEEWIILELNQQHPIPAINGVGLNTLELDAQEEQSDREDAQAARETVKVEGTVSLEFLEDELKVVGISLR